jgi:hypothetical protein
VNKPRLASVPEKKNKPGKMSAPGEENKPSSVECTKGEE